MAQPVQSNEQPTRPGLLPPAIILNSSTPPSSGASSSVDQEQPQQHAPSLASLSRNTSVISSSSSSSSTSSIVAPIRPRPLRSWSQSPPPGSVGRRARSPNSPTTPRQQYAPSNYLTHQLGIAAASTEPHYPTSPPSPTYGSSSAVFPNGTPAGSSAGGLQASIYPAAAGADSSRAATISSSLAGASPRPAMVPRTRTSSAVKKLYSISDFDLGEPLGEGSYSTVLAATFRRTGQMYAVKVIDKYHLTRFNKVKYAYVEKDSLARLSTAGHPGVVRLNWAFSDANSLYFVLDLVPNGELVTKINKLGSLSLECSRYYSAQILDAIIWMHGLGVIHRDMKPENVLLDENMRVKITDFGTAKILADPNSDERATSFVGSPGYISPELLLSSSCGKSADFWSVGCVIFHMIAGVQPFKALTSYLSMEKTKKAEYTFPEGIDPQARDLIANLLVVDPEKRLGDVARGGPQPIREHPFFKDVEWTALWTLDAPPLEAGLVKKEPPRRRSKSKHRSTSRAARSHSRAPTANGEPSTSAIVDEDEDVVVDDSDSDSDSDDDVFDFINEDSTDHDYDDDDGDDGSRSRNDADSGSTHGEAWAALVQGLDGPNAEGVQPRGPTPSASRGKLADDEDNEPGAVSDQGTIGTKSLLGMTPLDRGRSTSRGTPRSSSHVPVPLTTVKGGEVIARDTHYGSTNGPSSSSSAPPNGTVTPPSGSGSEGAHGGTNSPALSDGTSSTGVSEGQGSWAHLLNPGERVLFSSSARIRHRGMFQARVKLKPRVLVLTDQSRLLCIKTSNKSSPSATTTANASNSPSHTRQPSTSESKKHSARIKIEILLTRPPASASSTGGSSVSPAGGPGDKARRGSSVSQTQSGSAMRRLSVSTTASRISIRGRSIHRKSAEVLTTANAYKEKGEAAVSIQTDGQSYTYVVDNHPLAQRWQQEILAAQQEQLQARSTAAL
ncbi:kinase-like protein [Clavulina sp. PMI_390]|nr:kinase-like protein [Clavulina sp. PMI_390]